MARLLRLTLCTALIASVSLSALVSCLSGSPRATTDMACCQTDHDCGPAMQAADCCKASQSVTETFVGVKPPSVVKPMAVPSFLAVTSLSSPGTGHASRFLITSPGSSSPPLHLIAASLRI